MTLMATAAHPKRLWCLLLAGFVVCLLLDSASALDQMMEPLDRQYLDSALVLLNLRHDELGFDKMWVDDDTFRLAVVEHLLKNPLALPDYVDSTVAQLEQNARRPYELLDFLGRQLRVDPNFSWSNVPSPSPEGFDPQNPLAVWESALAAAEPWRRRFYAALDSLDLHDLIMAAPTLWSEAGDSVNRVHQGEWQREFGTAVDTSRKVDSDRLLDIIKKFDMESLIIAARIVIPAAQTTARGFAANDWSTLTAYDLPDVVGKVIWHHDTPWGRFVVGAAGDNQYQGDFAVIIDVGGNDVYRGRVGGAMGWAGHPYGLVVDLSGDDYYDAGGIAVSQGAGCLGIGVLIDRGGDDTYRGGAYAQGAGLFGVGVLADHGGQDLRRAGFFAQGAAHCGLGILIDDAPDSTLGNDQYSATTWAQGFGGTFGFGVLYDSGGNDQYRIGGAYLHEPLLPHDHRSFGGGFGMGWRPRAGGGIGVLYDAGAGVDFYDAEVMALGASYWYSLGILVDGGGNDHYSLAHYGLGVGIHLSVGALFDRDGDDQYRSRWGVVGGTPHDLSVGMMVDGGGDDYYIVGDGWGGSLTNSFGVFIDRMGNDLYATRGTGTSFGSINWARGFAGAAVFLDLEGDDVYPAGELAADSSIWMKSPWGIGIDLPRDTISTEKEEPIGEIVLTSEDSARSVEELFNEASLWEVGSARKTVARARKALLVKGPESLRYGIENRLGDRSGLVMRTFEELVKAMPDTAGPMLVKVLDDARDEWRLRNAVYLLGTAKWQPAVTPLLVLLQDSSRIKAWNSAIGALGQIGDRSVCPELARFLSDPVERRRLSAVSALGALKDSAVIPQLVNRLDDSMFTVRSAAGAVLANMGASAVPPLIDYALGGQGLYTDIAVRALGRIGSSLKDSAGTTQRRAVKLATAALTKCLKSSDALVRAGAVEGLYRLGDSTRRKRLEKSMSRETNPVVKAAFQRARKEAGE